LPLSIGACSTAPAAIDQYLLPTGRSAANPPVAVAAVDRWDRRTDGRMAARRYIDLAPHNVQVYSVNDAAILAHFEFIRATENV